jgi:hypothetical protein
MWRQVPVVEFGGLQLNEAPDVVGLNGAIDGLNFDHDARSAIRNRGGYEDFTTVPSQPQAMAVLRHTDGVPYLVIGHATGLVAKQNGTTEVATYSAPGPWSFIRHGGPTASAVYCANGQGQVIRYRVSDGFTLPTGLQGQTGRFLSVSPNSNRLVVAREAGNTLYNSPFSVNFSDQANPENFTQPPAGAVELDPGDGEPITGLALWREYQFVFKPRKFYVFYGENIQSSGAPEFLYREVDTGLGTEFTRGVVSGRAGIYFVARDGIYVTTGGPPQRVSGAIDVIFQKTPSFWSNGDLTMSLLDNLITLSYHDERLYLTYDRMGGDAVDRMLVYDLRYDFWTVWETKGTQCVATWFTNEGSFPLIGWSDGTTHKIAIQKNRGIDFASVAFPSYYTFGYSDLGVQVEKNLREVSVWGGLAPPGEQLHLSVARDFQAHNGAVRLAALKPSGGTGKFQRVHARTPLTGSLISLKVRSEPGVQQETIWNVQRLIMEMRENRMPGTGTHDLARKLLWRTWDHVEVEVADWNALVTKYPTWDAEKVG